VVKRGLFRGCDFSGQSLRNKDMREADLRNCRFFETDMRGANLERANLSGADLTNAIIDDTTRLLGCVMHETVGARRNGGPLVSVVGLSYPVVIDGRWMIFCQDVRVGHVGRDTLEREELIRMDKRRALDFHDLGCSLLKWYRTIK